jgi:hypothetical protein
MIPTVTPAPISPDESVIVDLVVTPLDRGTTGAEVVHTPSECVQCVCW